MFVPLIATAALASSLALDVPYLPQTDALCGGAAVAMVYRYWGDVHADVRQFASLVDRRAGGIADAALVETVRQRGWTADRFEGSVPQLRANLAAGRPVIVLLTDGRDRYHYVVVIGAAADRIVVHDPAWGPSRSLRETDFLNRWRATRFWSLLVLPAPDSVVSIFSRPPQPSVVSGFSRTSQSPDSNTTAHTSRCETLIADAIVSIQRAGLASADDILAGVIAKCPEASGPVRELAGVRFAQRRWSDAASLARRAVTLDPGDSYAWDVLGSSLFMQDDAAGALRAWNQIGRPRVNLVRIEGLRRTRYQLVAGALPIVPGEVLTAAAFERSQRMLDDLPDRRAARLTLRPEADGFASIDIVVQERGVKPHGAAEWAAVSTRTAVDREMSVVMPGATGQGELWTASWRWWADRPRVAISFAAPRAGRLAGVWHVDGSWEAQTYGLGSATAERQLRESRAHGSLTVGGWLTGGIRYALTGGLDSWNDARRDASVGASIEHRWIGDRVSAGVDGTRWVSLSGDRGFSSLGIHASVRASPDVTRWDYRIVSGIDWASAAAPFALWSGAGDGRARGRLLRAHPLLIDGVIEAGNPASFGRTLVFGSAEAQRWLKRPQLPRLGLAGFADVARGSRGFSAGSGTNVDIGGGLRLRVPGWDGILRVDLAHGLRDGRNAMTFGWLF
jgi:hypothetical protein